MAKRRAEETLLLDSPSKRRYLQPFCSLDMRPESSMAPTGGVSPPTLLALVGSRCRKRSHNFENEERVNETAYYFRSSHCESKKHAADVSGNFQEGCSSCTEKMKRPRLERDDSETGSSPAKTIEDTHTEDCLYNSFQFWRVPLPDLDLSLLDNPSDNSQTKHKAKVSNYPSDAMET